MSALEIRNIRKNYGAVETLKGIDIALQSGEFLVLLGPSGCGKSTLLNIIAGLAEATSGDVLIGGRSVLGVHPKNRDIAMVFQSYALYPNLTVHRNIGFGLEMRGVAADERDKAVREAAKLLQIENLLDRKPSQLSGGQRQRVAIGRALVRKPQVFLFDEPLSNLDAKLRLEMRTELKRLHQLLQTTVVYVTHEPDRGVTLATRIAVMRGKKRDRATRRPKISTTSRRRSMSRERRAPSMNMRLAVVANGRPIPTCGYPCLHAIGTRPVTAHRSSSASGPGASRGDQCCDGLVRCPRKSRSSLTDWTRTGHHGPHRPTAADGLPAATDPACQGRNMQLRLRRSCTSLV